MNLAAADGSPRTLGDDDGTHLSMHMIKRTVVILMTVAVVLAAAQVRPAGPDTVSRAEVVLAAKQALAAASHNLSRWLTIIIIAVLLVAVVAAWRMWSLAVRLARVEDLRAAWETRFAETADEVLRMKRKLAEAENKAGRLEDDIAALRPVGAEAATAQVAMVQSELVAVRERLDRAEEKLEAVADHTVVTKQDRAAVEELVKTAGQARVAAEAAAASAQRTAAQAVAAVNERLDRAEEKLEAVKDHTAVTKRERSAVEELVKTAGQARVAAEAAATRAERTAALAAAADSLRTGDENLAQHLTRRRCRPTRGASKRLRPAALMTRNCNSTRSTTARSLTCGSGSLTPSCPTRPRSRRWLRSGRGARPGCLPVSLGCDRARWRRRSKT